MGAKYHGHRVLRCATGRCCGFGRRRRASMLTPTAGDRIDDPVIIGRGVCFRSPKLVTPNEPRGRDCRPHISDPPLAQRPGSRRRQRPAVASTDFPPLFVPVPALVHQASFSIDLCRRPSGGANGADNEPPPKLLALVGTAGKALDKSLQAIQKETLRSGLDV